MPDDEVEWLVAGLSSHPGRRLLTVSRGKETVLSLIYRDNDGATEERRAWAALVAALRP